MMPINTAPASKPPASLVGWISLAPTEAQEMRILAQWLDYAGVLWVHCPNEGKRSFATAARLRAEGMRKGFPDLIVLTPAPNHPEHRGVAIELKRVHRGKLSAEQKQWLEDLAAVGWCTRVAFGAADAIGFLMALGYGHAT